MRVLTYTYWRETLPKPVQRFGVAMVLASIVPATSLATYSSRFTSGLQQHYIVPVSGVKGKQVRSTWGAPRSGGRQHRGVDIFAPRGRAVVASTDGIVWAKRENSLGGKIVYILGEDFSLQYYAHLHQWRRGLEPGELVKAGDPIGSVGNTGNAKNTPSHLHFGLTYLSPFRKNTHVDPALVLRHGGHVASTTLAAAAERRPPERKAITKRVRTLIKRQEAQGPPPYGFPK